MSPSTFTFHGSLEAFAGNYAPTIEEDANQVAVFEQYVMNFVDMDDMRVISATDQIPVLWTDALATCHALCVYGFDPAGGGLLRMGLAHASIQVEGTLDDLLDDMREGMPDIQLLTLVVGGQKTSFEEVAPFLKGASMKMHGIRTIMTGMTGNGSALTLAMTPMKVIYRVNSGTPSPTPSRASSMSRV
jgi:hypothetical protein